FFGDRGVRRKFASNPGQQEILNRVINIGDDGHVRLARGDRPAEPLAGQPPNFSRPFDDSSSDLVVFLTHSALRDQRSMLVACHSSVWGGMGKRTRLPVTIVCVASRASSAEYGCACPCHPKYPATTKS